MIKKVIITGLIVYGIFIVYQKFIAPNSKSFLNGQSTIDFMGISIPNVDKITKNK